MTGPDKIAGTWPKRFCSPTFGSPRKDSLPGTPSVWIPSLACESRWQHHSATPRWRTRANGGTPCRVVADRGRRTTNHPPNSGIFEDHAGIAGGGKAEQRGRSLPRCGRLRTDNGVKHEVSGLWHQPTVVSIARNPLLMAVCSYGTRSMGDQLRFTPKGPRELESHDYRADEKPKVIRNQESDCVTAPARFEPLIPLEDHQQLIAILDQRSGTQRGKPRSQIPQEIP